jgi:hypothetical protein
LWQSSEKNRKKSQNSNVINKINVRCQGSPPRYESDDDKCKEARPEKRFPEKRRYRPIFHRHDFTPKVLCWMGLFTHPL